MPIGIFYQDAPESYWSNMEFGKMIRNINDIHATTVIYYHLDYELLSIAYYALIAPVRTPKQDQCFKSNLHGLVHLAEWTEIARSIKYNLMKKLVRFIPGRVRNKKVYVAQTTCPRGFIS